MTENIKYCLYANRNVVLSEFNNNGRCACLTCKQEHCDKENCETAQNRCVWSKIMLMTFGVKSWCKECVGIDEK